MRDFVKNISGIFLISLVLLSIVFLQNQFKGLGDATYVIAGTLLAMIVFLSVIGILLLVGFLIRKILEFIKK
jgi:hypothetical protein